MTIFILNKSSDRFSLFNETLTSSVRGILRGYDILLNLVIDDGVEYLKGTLQDAPTPFPNIFLSFFDLNDIHDVNIICCIC